MTLIDNFAHIGGFLGGVTIALVLRPTLWDDELSSALDRQEK